MAYIKKTSSNTLKKVLSPTDVTQQGFTSFKYDVELLKSQINNITKQEFTATQDQTDFTMDKDLVLPVLVYNGSIQSSDTYTFNGKVLKLNDGAEKGDVIQIINLR